MTQHEFFELISKGGTISEGMVAYAKDQMMKIEEKNRKAQEKHQEQAKANLPIKKAIYDYLVAHNGGFASEISKALSTAENEVSTSKVSSMCRQMEEDGLVQSKMEKSPATKSKAKKYSVVPGSVAPELPAEETAEESTEESES